MNSRRSLPEHLAAEASNGLRMAYFLGLWETEP